MWIMKKVSIVIVLLGVLVAGIAFGTDQPPRRGGNRQGPPPEAYTACEGKNEGDQAEFTSPRGDTVTGTCVQEGDKLVLRPDRPPKKDSDSN